MQSGFGTVDPHPHHLSFMTRGHGLLLALREGYFGVCGIAVLGVKSARYCGIKGKIGGIAVLSFYSAVYGIVIY